MKRDIVVFNLHKKDQVLLIFPTGAKIKDQSGLLEGEFTEMIHCCRLDSFSILVSKYAT